jgi:primase-polymerase (primpol)-like protein
VKFKRLWEGDACDYHGNHTDADLALCRILVFWCGPRPQVVDRVFRRSGLFRSKWDKPHYSDGRSYGHETIHRAIRDQNGVFYKWPVYSRCYPTNSRS